jgi:PAS domain S-box-containing protein
MAGNHPEEVDVNANDEWYRHIVDAVPEGIWVADAQGATIFCNRRMAEILGTDIPSLRKWSCFDAVFPEELEDAHRHFECQMSGGSPFDFRLRRADGSAIWVNISCQPVVDDDGTVHGLLGLFTDISEHKRMDAERRAAEAQLIRAQRLARIGSWERDIATNRIRLSEETLRMLGRIEEPPATFAEVLSQIHPMDREKLIEAGKLAASTTGPVTLEFRLSRTDGETRFAHSIIEAIRDDQGVPIIVTGATQDITETVLASQRLRESDDRFRNMADNAPVMIWVADPDQRFIFLNRTWLSFTGRTLDQELGDGWKSGIHPEDRERCFAMYSGSFDARQPLQMEHRLRRTDGVYRSVLCNGVPRFTPNGAFEGYIGSCVDISDLKRAQEESVSRQKMESLGLLAAGITHDFGNLLGGILAHAELASGELPRDATPLEELRQIRTLAVRASEIVRELMVYAGHDTADFEPVDLSRLVREMLELLKISLSKRAVLKTSLADDLPAVRGQAPRIRQVVMNLMTNASEALGTRNGEITITTSLATVGDVVRAGTTGLPPGRYVRLDVSDTGSGMTEEQRSKVFDPFFTTKVEGRGLGLAVVHGVVRAHGGAIHLITAPGQGTTFQILFPCSGRPVETPVTIQTSA